MLTLPLTSFSDLTTGTLVADAQFAFHWNAICTNFDHDATQTSFTGDVVLAGYLEVLFLVSSSVVSSNSTPAHVELTVHSAVYDTAASTGHAVLTGITGLLPFVFTIGVTDITATFDMGLSLEGSTAIAGTIDGDMTFLSGTTSFVRTAEPRPYSLAVGAFC